MSIFDILGPVMVGPSSSHTAGAVRIGLIARALLEDTPVYADIKLHGSFAATGKGHGTDRALVAGLLGMEPNDTGIPESFEKAFRENLKFYFSNVELQDAHPNTAVINLQGASGRKLEIQASSIGGGRIMVNKIDGIEVNFNAELPTLIVHNSDKPGLVAAVTSLLGNYEINIATMQLYRNERGGYAVTVIECDQNIPLKLVDTIEGYKGVLKVTYVNTSGENA